MNKLRSEILFNRALLFMVMGALAEGATFKVAFLAVAVLTVVRPAMAYGEGE